jgi:acetoin utilization protein AcuB
MNVGDIMTRHVVTVTPDDTLRHVREVFESCRFHHLVVVEQGRVVGILSDRDLLKNISPFLGRLAERTMDRSCLTRHVHQIMSRRVISVVETTPVADAARRMLDHRVSCLPVTDADDACVGILTVHDMLNWALVECAAFPKQCNVHKAA